MNTKSIQKTFIVGDKWLYYKLYCGASTADSLLLKVISPLTNQLLEDNLIEKWFFIRYSDPEPHLRIRFYITDLQKLAAIIITIKESLEPYIISKQIWNVQIDVYQRELERYGINSIENSESFFYNDSKQIISILKNNRDEKVRFLAVFKRVEVIIKSFSLNDTALLSFLDNLQTSFKEEFKVDKRMKKELSDKYRNFESLLLESATIEEDIKTRDIITEILQLEKQGKLTIAIEKMLASFIHMTVNRVFSSKQRMYEMMLYDFLHRKNKSIFARYGKL